MQRRSGWEVGKEGEVVLGGGTDLNRCSCNTNVDSLHPFGQKTSVDLFPTSELRSLTDLH